jgi:RNA polymerase sigma factor (sigma-70 family)
MKIYEELYRQLKHLVSSIPACNYISYEDKKDIIQDTIITLNSKIENGSLSDDFNEIKGYSFITLKNYCISWQRKEQKRETPVAEFWELEDETITPEEIEYREHLHKLVNSYIQHNKYTSLERKIVDMMLDNFTNEEIRNETGLVGKEVGKYNFRIKNKLKFDSRRPIKYIIKNVFNEKIMVPCYTVSDAKNYLSDIPPRRVTYMASDGYITKDGFYIETLIKRKKRTKK